MSNRIEKYFSCFYPKNICDAFSSLETAVNQDMFTAWSFATPTHAISGFWADEYPLSECEHGTLSHPVFDLASLTKPLFLNLLIFIQHPQDYVEFISTPLSKLWINSSPQHESLLDEFIHSHPHLTLNHFLSHHTYIRPWLWMGGRTFDTLMAELLSPKNTSFSLQSYSDLNYFLLARIVEILHCKEMDETLFWTQQLKQINTTLNTHFAHSSIAPAVHSVPFFPYIPAKKEAINLFPSNLRPPSSALLAYGPVHDTNANILATQFNDKRVVSGHAGLFGNTNDISLALKYMNTNKLFSVCAHEKHRTPAERFIYGFDTPSSPSSTAGILHWKKNKNQVFGHLGFSGTSFWTEAHSHDFHILLTNRTSHRNTDKLCPRIYIFENIHTNKKNYYLLQNNSFTELNKSECLEKNKAYCQRSDIIWDSKYIPSYANISDIRKNLGLSLWGV